MGALVVLGAVHYVVPSRAYGAMGRRTARRTGISRRIGLTLLAALVLGPLVGYLLAPPPVDGSPLVGTLVYGLYLGGLFVLATAAGNRSLYRRVAAADGPPELTPGPTVFGGAATCETPDTAPFSGREAVCWAAEVEVNADRHLLRDRPNWLPIEATSGGVPFRVDGVLVDPAAARIAPFGPLPGMERGPAHEFVDEYLPDEVREGLARVRGVAVEAVENHAGDDGARFRDAVVAPGDPVTVVGTLERVPAGEYDDTLVVRDGDPFVVLGGDLDTTRRALRVAVVRNGVVGAVLVALSVVAGLFLLGVA